MDSYGMRWRVIAGCCERGLHDAENLDNFSSWCVFCLHLYCRFPQNVCRTSGRRSPRFNVVSCSAIWWSQFQIASRVSLMGYDVVPIRRNLPQFEGVRYLSFQRLYSTRIDSRWGRNKPFRNVCNCVQIDMPL
jgi:hypothetical protein